MTGGPAAVRRVAVLDDYQGVALRMADWASLADVEVVAFRDHAATEDHLVERLRGFQAVVAMRERTPFPRAVLERLGDLELLVTTGSRNAAIDVVAAGELGVTVCGTRTQVASTAEMVWALVLASARHVPQEDAAVRRGGWQETVGVQLAGSTLGLLGLGRVGGAVAAFGRAFAMDVVAWSQNLTPERAAACGARRVDRDDLFALADVLSVHVRLSARTEGLVGAAELRAMKPSAVLVNTSRGAVVDEAALVTALHDGWIAGAALDVFDVEPLPAGHPLLGTPNTVLTPHVGYVTETTYRMFYGDAVEDIRAFLAGSPVRVVEPG